MRNELNYTDIEFASRISVDNMSRAFLSTYIPGATDYINAVFVDVSILSYGLFTFTVDLDSDFENCVFLEKLFYVFLEKLFYGYESSLLRRKTICVISGLQA